MTNNKKVLIKSEKEMSKLASELVGGILDNPDVKYGIPISHRGHL